MPRRRPLLPRSLDDTPTALADRPSPALPAAPGQLAGRSIAVDVLRGITIVGMVLVNNPGSSRGWKQLNHAAWNGATLADLVFPGFLFVMGVSISLAFARRRAAPAFRMPVAARQIVRRALLLIAIGVVLNWLNPLTGGALRYPGVLQRIGLAYLVAAMVVLLLPLPGQLVVGAALMGGYWLALLHFHVPGHGAGVLTPAGNFAGWVDRSVFGQAHLYRHAPYDPEGLASTADAVVSVLAGVWAGEWLRRRGRSGEAAAALAAVAVAVLGVAWWWRQWLPLNKRLWSPSYTLWTAGWLALALAVLWGLIEVRGWRWMRQPWAILGANALLLYIVTELGDRVTQVTHVGQLTVHAWTYDRWFASWLTAVPASLAWSVSFLAIWGLACSLLYRRGVFLRL